MPLGWYLAQGLLPLTASSSDDEEGPCELPDGRLVCGPHGRVWCGKCCVDYSFMDEVLSRNGEDGYESGDHPDSGVEATHGPNTTGPNASRSNDQPIPLRRGTGRAFPTKFIPPSASETPLELFSGRKSHMLVNRHANAYFMET